MSGIRKGVPTDVFLQLLLQEAAGPLEKVGVNFFRGYFNLVNWWAGSGWGAGGRALQGAAACCCGVKCQGAPQRPVACGDLSVRIQQAAGATTHSVPMVRCLGGRQWGTPGGPAGLAEPGREPPRLRSGVRGRRPHPAAAAVHVRLCSGAACRH